MNKRGRIPTSWAARPCFGNVERESVTVRRKQTVRVAWEKIYEGDGQLNAVRDLKDDDAFRYPHIRRRELLRIPHKFSVDLLVYDLPLCVLQD